MTITTPKLAGPGVYPINVGPMLAFNNDEDDASTAVDCVAAPGVGKAVYVRSITISGRTADIAITMEDGDGLDLFGPIQMQDGGTPFTKDWPKDAPLKVTDNKALSVLGSAASAFTIYGEYYIGQAPIV